MRLVCAAVEARLSVLGNEHSINEHSIAIATALPIAQIRTGQGEDLGNSFIACEIYKVASLGQFGINSTPHVTGWGGAIHSPSRHDEALTMERWKKSMPGQRGSLRSASPGH